MSCSKEERLIARVGAIDGDPVNHDYMEMFVGFLEEYDPAFLQKLLQGNQKDFIDLRAGRDFLDEHDRYDVVLLESIYNEDYNNRGKFTRSPLHSKGSWNARLLETGAKYIVSFGTQDDTVEVTHKVLGNLPGYATVFYKPYMTIYQKESCDMLQENTRSTMLSNDQNENNTYTQDTLSSLAKDIYVNFGVGKVVDVWDLLIFLYRLLEPDQEIFIVQPDVEWVRSEEFEWHEDGTDEYDKIEIMQDMTVTLRIHRSYECDDCSDAREIFRYGIDLEVTSVVAQDSTEVTTEALQEFKDRPDELMYDTSEQFYDEGEEVRSRLTIYDEKDEVVNILAVDVLPDLNRELKRHIEGLSSLGWTEETEEGIFGNPQELQANQDHSEVMSSNPRATIDDIELTLVKRPRPQDFDTSDTLLVRMMKDHYSKPRGFMMRTLVYEVSVADNVYGYIVAGRATRNLPQRDEYLGISSKEDLDNIVNNVFYHIEKVDGRYPMHDFTTKVLIKWMDRVKIDWFERYGDPVLGFETLIEPPRTGDLYIKAGWVTAEEMTKGYTCKTDHGKKVWAEGTQKYVLYFQVPPDEVYPQIEDEGEFDGQNILDNPSVPKIETPEGLEQRREELLEVLDEQYPTFDILSDAIRFGENILAPPYLEFHESIAAAIDDPTMLSYAPKLDAMYINKKRRKLKFSKFLRLLRDKYGLIDVHDKPIPDYEIEIMADSWSSIQSEFSHEIISGESIAENYPVAASCMVHKKSKTVDRSIKMYADNPQTVRMILFYKNGKKYGRALLWKVEEVVWGSHSSFDLDPRYLLDRVYPQNNDGLLAYAHELAKAEGWYYRESDKPAGYGVIDSLDPDDPEGLVAVVNNYGSGVPYQDTLRWGARLGDKIYLSTHNDIVTAYLYAILEQDNPELSPDEIYESIGIVKKMDDTAGDPFGDQKKNIPTTAIEQNPFKAKPATIHGSQSWGSQDLPGFHTADDKEVAAAYGVSKIQSIVNDIRYITDEDDEEEFKEAYSSIGDYPVVVGVDTAGYIDVQDLDFHIRLGEVIELYINEIQNRVRNGDSTWEEEFEQIEQFDKEYINLHMGFLPVFFDLRVGEGPGEILQAIIESPEHLERFFDLSFWNYYNEVNRYIGQHRYRRDVRRMPKGEVQDERIISIEYVTPIWDKIIDEYSDIGPILQDMGWEYATEQDASDGSLDNSFVFTPVWSRTAPDGAGIEYHGTTYRNLIEALPWIEGEIPLPPPPFNPDDYVPKNVALYKSGVYGSPLPVENPCNTRNPVGGIAQGMTVADLARHHGVSASAINKQLRKGIEKEMEEHTNDRKVAREIAMDHVLEMVDYYDRLEEMEENPSTYDEVEADERWNNAVELADQMGIPAYEGQEHLADLQRRYRKYQDLGTYWLFLDRKEKPQAIWVP